MDFLDGALRYCYTNGSGRDLFYLKFLRIIIFSSEALVDWRMRDITTAGIRRRMCMPQ